MPESSLEILGHSLGGVTYRHYGLTVGLRKFGILPLVSYRNEEMVKTKRRDILRFGSASLAFPLLAMLDVSCMSNEDGTTTGSAERLTDNESTENKKETVIGAAMKIQYLEIVSPGVDAICKTYEQLHGVTFGEPNANLGNARTAKLPNGGLLGVRAPLRETEEPVVRPYFLVEDIDASVSHSGGVGCQDCTAADGTSGPRKVCHLHTRRCRAWTLATVARLGVKLRGDLEDA